jgi:very-short-patch-repair endonuclease
MLTSRGKSILRGKKVSVTKRKPIGAYKAPVENVRLSNGKTLNIPESQIYRALEKMHENFSSQVALKGGSTLGGSLCDFVLWDRRLVLEFQGPFHNTDQGREKDFWRKLRREQAGFWVVYLKDKDLINLHRRLWEIMGAPSLASIQSGGYRV